MHRDAVNAAKCRSLSDNRSKLSVKAFKQAAIK